MKKKKFIVMPRERHTVLNGLQTGKGHRSFQGKTYMHISDPAEAKEIDERYGQKGTQEVYIAEDQQYARALDGEKWDIKSDLKETNVKVLHNYHFGQLNIEEPGGNERVRVKTKDGFTFVSRAVAIEEGLTIAPQRRRPRGKRREVKHGIRS